jgi:hypothetical protein
MSGLDSDLDFLLVEALSEAASLSGRSVRSSSRLSSSSHATSAPSSAGRAGGVGSESEGGFSGGGRFSQGSVSSLKMYSVVRISGGDESICFGSVGTGNASFCIKKHCSIKAHMESKVSIMGIRSTRIFISRKVGSTVFVEPSVDSSKISAEVWENWKQKQGSLREWNQEFCAVDIADRESATMDEVKLESSFLSRAEKDFKTPAKRAREGTGRGLLIDEEQGNPMGKATVRLHERTFPPVESAEWEELMGTKGIKKSMVTLALSEIESSVIALGESIGIIVTQSQARFAEIEQDSKVVAGAVHTLSSSVGSSVEIDNQFEAPTLWGTTAFITHELVRIGGVVKDLEMELNPLKEAMIERELTSKESWSKMEDSCRKTVKALVLVMNRVKEINPELDILKAKVEKVEGAQQRSSKRAKHHGPGDDDYEGFRTARDRRADSGNDGGVDDLMQLLGRNNLDVRSTSESNGAPSRNHSPDSTRAGNGEVGQTSGDTTTLNTLCEEMAKMVGAVETLVEEVGILKLCVEDKSVKFGGLGLRSKTTSRVTDMD